MGPKTSKHRLVAPVNRQSSINIVPLNIHVQSEELGCENSDSTASSPKMAEYLNIDDIKEAVMECPVCIGVFDAEDHAPRLIPCCIAAVCTRCLTDIIARGNGTLECPLCRKSHDVTGGIETFPLERVMLKMIEYLRLQKGHNFPCTGCPDGNEANSRCRDCGFFLCEDCLSAHKRNGVTRDHVVVGFDELRSLSIRNFSTSHHCPQHKLNPLQFYCHKCDKVICVSCTVVDHKESEGHNIASVDQICKDRANKADVALNKLDGKATSLASKIEDLQKKRKTLSTSRTAAKKQIEETFDALISDLKLRKGLLITEVDTRFDVHDSAIDRRISQVKTLVSRVSSAYEYVRHVRSKADDIESVQLYSRLSHVVEDIMEESTEEEEWSRKGLGFDPVHADDLGKLVQLTGVVRTMTYTCNEDDPQTRRLLIEPVQVPKDPSLQTKVTMCGHATDTRQPFDVEGCHGDRLIVLEDVTIDARPAVIQCPPLHFDPICASRDCSTTPEGVMVNRKRHRSAAETGCRLRVGRRVLVSSPFGGRGLQLWQTTVRTKVKAATEDNNGMLFEAALTPKPVDAFSAQPVGFSLNLSNCDVHQQLCLKVRQDGDLKADVPAILNEPEVEHDLDLCFLLDSNQKKLHVFELNGGVTVSVNQFDVSNPLWLLFYVDTPEESEMEVKLVSGHDITVNENLIKLLKSVC